MSDASNIFADVQDAAKAYGDAVYFARADVFENLCHDQFQMTLVEDGATTFWDKAAYLDRVRGRRPFEAPARYTLLSIDVAGTDIARVHLTVDVHPVRYEDHLGFVHVDGSWKLLTKVFRIAANLDEEETP